MFATLLIANRGEIACRIIRTARRMGLRTIAVYSDADAQALHVAMADAAVRIGPPPARESYLSVERVVAAALDSGADAVHPGYGFLSESPELAEACAKAGLIFVGPPPAAIRAMGSKSEAKGIMAEAGVPVVPGYHGPVQDAKTLAREAGRIGYPVLIKASAGGGGKGMRRVDKAGEFAAALASARREAASAFGDDRILLERYLLGPRHVEVQVFADNHGSALHLFERDCSVQRRHQKVVEEAPAPGLDRDLREKLGRAAVAAARAIGYAGAGTVEFILDRTGAFYFMEMNTRLQVEHPVTEMITRLDLVEWQLRVAAGEKLPLAQDAIESRGHAVEARLYAEDPARDFLPTGGRLEVLELPEDRPAIRIDTGVRAGDVIGADYDPLIAKVIAWSEDRGAALRRLFQALAGCRIGGVVTNLNLLLAIASHPEFTAGPVDTGFLERHRGSLIPEHPTAPDQVLALAALAVLQEHRRSGAGAASTSADPHSPWHLVNGWRLNGEARYPLTFFDETGSRHEIMVHFRGFGFQLDLPGGPVAAAFEPSAPGMLQAILGPAQITAPVTIVRDRVAVLAQGRWWTLTLLDRLSGREHGPAMAGRVTAPMPGRIVAVSVQVGDAVSRGATLMALEAMKMEHAIAAPADGRVAAIHYRVGDLVEDGVELLVLEAAGT